MWVYLFVECRNVELSEGGQVKNLEHRREGLRVDRWGDEGTSGYVITVDYRDSVLKGGTWPGGRATLQGNPPWGARGIRRPDDARYIYISYTLLSDLHLFEQVKICMITRLSYWVNYVIENKYNGGNS